MKQFKKGDIVKRVASSHEGMRVGDTAVVSSQEGIHLWLDGYDTSHDTKNFELVEDENVMSLKKNWSLDINSENAEVYKQTLIALGYTWSESHTVWISQSYIRTDNANNNKVFFSNMTEHDHFEDIEEFLKFHFIPQKTEAQLKLEDLQKIIEDAQKKIKQLKEEV